MTQHTYIMQATAHEARDHLKELSIFTIVNVTSSGAVSQRELNPSSNHSFQCLTPGYIVDSLSSRTITSEQLPSRRVSAYPHAA